jgi:hypothetical protein
MSEVAKQIERDEQRRRNRERFPQMSKWIDEMRAAFGDVRVMWVKEGDQEAGTPSTEDWVPISEGDGYVGKRVGGKEAGRTAVKVGGVRKGFRR